MQEDTVWLCQALATFGPQKQRGPWGPGSMAGAKGGMAEPEAKLATHELVTMANDMNPTDGQCAGVIQIKGRALLKGHRSNDGERVQNVSTPLLHTPFPTCPIRHHFICEWRQREYSPSQGFREDKMMRVTVSNRVWGRGPQDTVKK